MQCPYQRGWKRWALRLSPWRHLSRRGRKASARRHCDVSAQPHRSAREDQIVTGGAVDQRIMATPNVSTLRQPPPSSLSGVSSAPCCALTGRDACEGLAVASIATRRAVADSSAVPVVRVVQRRSPTMIQLAAWIHRITGNTGCTRPSSVKTTPPLSP